MLTTENVTSAPGKSSGRSVQQLVALMTATAWGLLLIGAALCAFNLSHFSDQNAPLMIGIGFMVASVHVYVIRTAIHLVSSARLQ